MAGWPDQASWGEWLDGFGRLAPRAARTPAYVLLRAGRSQADGRRSVRSTLDEARRVLAARLLTLETDPPARRFGRVFVGTPQQARGRSFRVVFVPGLAERMFPQKPREDPLLLDDVRERDRGGSRHRQQARRSGCCCSWPSAPRPSGCTCRIHGIELSESRERVPSFYALDLCAPPPAHADHERWRSARARPATPRWRGRRRRIPAEAIDEQEHDLAVLRSCSIPSRQRSGDTRTICSG